MMPRVSAIDPAIKAAVSADLRRGDPVDEVACRHRVSLDIIYHCIRAGLWDDPLAATAAAWPARSGRYAIFGG